ncbi:MULTISPECIES: urease accessory protein UreD [Streptomyces]|uniref:Urease accessory protein UreD n=1 Tax=Streptomyces evansiae TaxID=3075535 RepID=A0ABU2QZL3_9ACTN|nr:MULTISPECIES: urease accessory protein UreD [unclassified Streptomyces]MDT0408465.1 urease accessory protein UreD [Streptomyces sp. DSM 41979]SCE22103.1 urease accessory protein [Streptomyces sp. DfronAA-171]
MTTAVAGARARVRIEARADGRGGTALPVLSGEGPLAARRTRGVPGAAHVVLVGAMGGPLGGDAYEVRAEAGPGARLRVGSVAATLALPGQSTPRSTYAVDLEAAGDGLLEWLPEPVVAVAGCDLAQHTRVTLAEGARLALREEQVLGRSGESPGRITSRLTVRLAGRPLLDQETCLGTGAPPGWDGPAGTAGRRAIGQLLLVAPEFQEYEIGAQPLAPGVVLLPLDGPAVLVSALAPDALRLRRLLDEAAQALGRPGV